MKFIISILFEFCFSSKITPNNGTPLQYSCLENSMDGGAWWAVVPGVAQSQTRLKRLSSSSSELKWPDAKDNSDKCFWGLIKRLSSL